MSSGSTGSIGSWTDLWKLQGSDTTEDRLEQAYHSIKHRWKLHRIDVNPPLPPFPEDPHPPPLAKHNFVIPTDMAKISTPIPRLKLSDGTSIPTLAYGTGTAWSKNADGSKTDRSLIDSIKLAMGMGYYNLDGADMYGTEPELGTAIKESKKNRDDVYVVTKVNKGTDDIAGALKSSLSKMKLDYVDLYLIHQPFFAQSDDDLRTAWKAMEEMKDQGLAKSIGVSNFLPRHLDAILHTAKCPPVINQIEFNPYLQHPALLDYHKAHGIATAAYGPLIPITKASPGPIDGYLAALGKKYAVNPSEILLRWCIEQDVVAVTTSSKEQRLSDYLRCCTFQLTPKEVQEIKTLGEGKQFRGFWTKKFKEGDYE